MAPMPTEWWLLPGQQRLPRRRAEGGGVETVVASPFCGQALGGRRVARAAEGAGGSEADVVDKDDQHVRRTLWRADGLIGANYVSGSFASYVTGPV